MEKLVIALDGPAGAGKTTVAKALSKKLNIPYFSTGAMYRALALKCLQNNLDAKSEKDAEFIANSTKVGLKFEDGEQKVILDGQDVTKLLYTDTVSQMASQISVHPIIRQKMVELQREVAKEGSVIMDGRDIGSVVLPMANYKFYLDADVEVRANRRFLELTNKGEKVTFEEVLADMKERDFRDKNRAVSPLIVCDDAIVIDCSKFNIEQSVDAFIKVLENK